jgi:hypothetical protein
MPSLRRFSLGFLLTLALGAAPLVAQEGSAPAESQAAIADRDPALLAAVLEKLSPESRKSFAEMLARDWKDRPEWAEMLIALLRGQPLELGVGWFQKGQGKYDWKWLAAKCDANQDGSITAEELPKDALHAEILMARLDRDGDGRLRAEDFDHFSQRFATPPQMMSRFLSAILDADSNGRITPEEWQAWVARADKDKTGFLTSEDLFEDFTRAFAELNGGGEDMPGPDQMLAMFFRGELGAWGSGPRVGQPAPDFSLPTHDHSRTVTLSASRGKPVILIFGSFT